MKVADIKDGIYRVTQQIRVVDEYCGSLYIHPGLYIGKVVEDRVELSAMRRRLRLTSESGKIAAYIDLSGDGELAVPELEALP